MSLSKMIMKKPEFLSCSLTPIVLYVLYLSLLAACGAGRSLHFASSLSVYHFDSGDEAYLQCILDGDSTHGSGGSFTWTGPAMDSGRASITLDRSGTVSRLTINNVGRSDEGTYCCSFTGVSAVSTILNVVFTPQFFPNISEYLHQKFIEETDAVVECPAFMGDVHPPANMIWTHNDREITDNRFTLEYGRMRIQNIRKADETTYKCSINHLGIIGSRLITVTVLERSDLAPKIVEPVSPIDVIYGDPLNLTCLLQEPRDNVHYTWTVDTDYEDSHVKNTTPSLHRDAEGFLGGRYTCKAENEYGYDEQVFYIRVLAPPEPHICSESEEIRNAGETVVLDHCQITSPVQLSDLDFQWSKRNGNGEWVEIRPGGRFKVNHNGVLTIMRTRTSDSGLYWVNISNSQGSALHTVRLQVDNPPDAAVVRLRFELSGSAENSCQEIQEMILKDSLTAALEKAICDRLETCSDGMGIVLSNSIVECSNPDSKVGTYTATTSGPSAAAKISTIGKFDVDLGNGISLTLNSCRDDCPSVNPQVQDPNTAAIVSGVVVSIVLLVLVVVVGALILTLLLCYKCRKPTNKVTDAELGHGENPTSTSQSQSHIINLSTASHNLAAVIDLETAQTQEDGSNQTQLSTQDTTQNLNSNLPVRPKNLCILGQNGSTATPKKNPVLGRSVSLDCPPRKQTVAQSSYA